MPDGSFQKVNIRKRPGSVAIASAIQNKYSIPAVPHIICKGFTKDETEYALIDLNFLGVHNLLLLRGDIKTLEVENKPELYHEHATDLQHQVNNFNNGIALDGSKIEGIDTPFSYGMACYPEKHEEAPNMDSDIFYLKEKVKNGADYLVTQMFFDNSVFYDFVGRCRAAGISVPIIPGLKPLSTARQVSSLPESFSLDIPVELTDAIKAAGDDREAVYRIGTEWCIMQCKDLLRHNIPAVHFYTMGRSRNIVEILKECF